MTYTPIRKCASFWAWLLFVRPMCGGTAILIRLFGWDNYGSRWAGFR
jgi:hypothetical protein